MALLTFVRYQWDRVAAWSCIALGGLLLLIGYLRISSTPFAAKQIPYLVSAGLPAVFLLGIGIMLWLSADLRDEWRKLDEIARQQAALPPEAYAWLVTQQPATDLAEAPALPRTPRQRATRGAATARPATARDPR
ncbi:MAG: hypothetical protein JWM64_191 [Frankiales bacterium]|nr:hypothetical protein [Frankiales bacterium]